MKKPPNISVNEEIQDRTIQHMIYLERFKNSEIKRIRKILDTITLPEISAQIEKRLRKILERGSDLGPETTARLQQLEKELLVLSKKLSDGVKQTTLDDMTGFSRDEINWQAQTINKSLGFELDLVIPNPRSVARVIKTTSFAGLKLDDWFDTLSRSTQRNVMAAVNQGVVQGETTDQIIRRVRGTKQFNYTDGVFETTRRQAETIVRSTVNHATNQSRLEFFKENEDIIKGLKWVSTLDSRTSSTCAALDGKVFPVDKGPRPPAHPNCRSTMTAVLVDAEELGIKKIPEGKRASIDGQVPASTTYGDWLKRQSVDVQETVLGVTRAKLFRAGKLPIERFVGADLQPLTLKELRTLEKNAFVQAGL